MRTTSLCVVVIASLLAATTTTAASNTVTDYNWLQLPPGSITASVATDIGALGNGYGSPVDYRWGNRVWIPSGAAVNGTDGGSRDYYAILVLDQPRQIKNVWTQWWIHEGTGLEEFFIDGSADGVTWTTLGSHNYGSLQVNVTLRTNVDVTDSVYQYVRVRVDAGGYAWGSASRGGPGLMVVEPMGDGSVDDDLVNWANQGNFSTVVSNNGLDFNGTAYNDGLLFEDGGGRAGDAGNMEAGDYLQIDLGASRILDGVTVVWEYVWHGNAYDVTYSNDGINFFPVAILSGPTTYAGVYGALGYTFSPQGGRYWRISNVTTPTSYALINEVLLYGGVPAGDPPVAVCQDATVRLEYGAGSLTAEDIDNGSYDPDLGAVTLVLDPTDFTCDDVGVATVTLTVIDETSLPDTCTASVTVLDLCDLCTIPLVPVTEYNWLQLPPDAVSTFTGTNQTSSAGNGYGDPDDYRWGDHVWIPAGGSGDGTDGGARDYFAALAFDQPRPVTHVWVQWWAQEGTSIWAFDIDGSNDGVTWTQIGTHDYGAYQTGARFRTNVDVTDGSYQYLRVSVATGDYTYGNAGRGGPGLYAIEPLGDGTVAENQANWLNRDNFSTTVANNGLTFNGTRYHDGFLYDDEGARTGQLGNWDAGDYIQMDLGQTRTLDRVVGVWDSAWNGTAFDISVSDDGVTYAAVAILTGPTVYTGTGALGYTFEPESGRYWRITNVAGPAYTLFNQVLLYGPRQPTASGPCVTCSELFNSLCDDLNAAAAPATSVAQLAASIESLIAGETICETGPGGSCPANCAAYILELLGL